MMCGYFVGVTLRADLTRQSASGWFQKVSRYVDELVARLPATTGEEKGDKVAAVAVGLGPSLFFAGGALRFTPAIDPPAGFEPGTTESPNPMAWDAPALAGVERIKADVMFYVASTFEARVVHFIEQLENTRPDVVGITVERGFQRVDGTEPFGYRDGARNMPRGVRSRHVFVQADEQVEEPRWAEGGSYMTYLRISQHRDAFRALADDAARDQVIGRHRDGTRLDLPAGTDPREEPAEPAPSLPPNSHVRKAGPRSRHDEVQIFRRGLPFMDAVDGQLRVGLNFASFQASLDQFDTVLNDWMMSSNFPSDRAGPDSLLDASRGFTTIERLGLYFVPPDDRRYLAATMFETRAAARVGDGRVVVRKRVVDPNDLNRRFERGGFKFRIIDAAGQQVGEEFATSSSGRAVFGGRLGIGSSYTLEELSSPFANMSLVRLPFTMTKPNLQLRVVNTIPQPNTPYGG